jgi:nucleoside-diphosphate-sugar epimerase
MESRPKLLITGVSGHLASWICKLALESREYQVYGSIRDATSEKRQKQLKEGFGKLYDDLTLVSLDLLDKESIEKAVEGMDYVIS